MSQTFQSAIAIAVAVALMLLIGMATCVRASDPWPWGQGIPWLTTKPWPTPRVLGVGERFSYGVVIVPATPTPFLAPLYVPAPPTSSSFIRPPSSFAAPVVTTRSGDSRMNALIPDGAARTLSAGASAWYKVGNGGEHIDVFLDANPLSGMALDVYAPGKLSDPIGRGTLQQATGRLVWAGGHWNSEGDWFARVTNGNPMAVQYTLTSSAHGISKKSCYSYWEYIGTQPVYWTECQ